ncbi:hypothetical protein D3C84_831950 [compost metagenome]
MLASTSGSAAAQKKCDTARLTNTHQKPLSSPTKANASADSSEVDRMMLRRRPRLSASQPHSPGATIRASVDSAISTEICTVLNDSDSRYNPQNGPNSPWKAK